jgi:DeoR/GlpR family transcriptional regulator of sugar metabolism
MVKIADEHNWDAICRRAGGRRRYNAQRRFNAEMRQLEVAQLIDRYGLLERGVQKRIADELGVSEATISRDVAHLLHMSSIRRAFDVAQFEKELMARLLELSPNQTTR